MLKFGYASGSELNFKFVDPNRNVSDPRHSSICSYVVILICGYIVHYCLLVLINVVGEAAQTYLQYTVHTTQPRILFRIYCCSLAIYFYCSIEYIIFPLLCIFLFGMFLCLFSILLFFFCTLFQIFPILVTHFLFLYNAFLFIIII